jgi:hypothetical protein
MRIKLIDLPEDMQQLIADMIDESDYHRIYNASFVMIEVPLKLFPGVRIGGRGDDRDIAYTMRMKGEKLPPVIIHGRKWLDGRHRVFLARKIGALRIPAIDLSGFKLASGSYIGKLKSR